MTTKDIIAIILITIFSLLISGMITHILPIIIFGIVFYILYKIYKENINK